jgi:protein-disulfide isomerase
MPRNHPQLRVPVGPDDHIQGGPSAPVTLVEYGDYECPHCRRAYPIVKRIQKRLSDRLRFIFRNFPLAEMHPHATAAAEAAEASALQGKFWQMHDILYENQDALAPADLLNYAQKLHLDIGMLQTALQDAAVAERVRSDFMGGVRSGVNGTPTFFINESRFDGDWTDMDEFIASLEAAPARGT